MIHSSIISKLQLISFSKSSSVQGRSLAMNFPWRLYSFNQWTSWEPLNWKGWLISRGTFVAHHSIFNQVSDIYHAPFCDRTIQSKGISTSFYKVHNAPAPNALTKCNRSKSTPSFTKLAASLCTAWLPRTIVACTMLPWKSWSYFTGSPEWRRSRPTLQRFSSGLRVSRKSRVISKLSQLLAMLGATLSRLGTMPLYMPLIPSWAIITLTASYIDLYW